MLDGNWGVCASFGGGLRSNQAVRNKENETILLSALLYSTVLQSWSGLREYVIMRGDGCGSSD